MTEAGDTVTAVVPMFVRVADRFFEVATGTLPKSSGEVSVGTTPVPLRFDVTVPAPVLTVSVPLRAWRAVGANRTLTEQLPPPARVGPHVVDAKLKSVPLTLATPTLSEADPVFVSVAVCVMKVLTFTFPKETADNVGTTPVPVSVPVTVPDAVLKVSDPVRVCAAVGMN